MQLNVVHADINESQQFPIFNTFWNQLSGGWDVQLLLIQILCRKIQNAKVMAWLH
jgi:hypothetical protein